MEITKEEINISLNEENNETIKEENAYPLVYAKTYTTN